MNWQGRYGSCNSTHNRQEGIQKPSLNGRRNNVMLEEGHVGWDIFCKPSLENIVCLRHRYAIVPYPPWSLISTNLNLNKKFGKWNFNTSLPGYHLSTSLPSLSSSYTKILNLPPYLVMELWMFFDLNTNM